MLKDVPLPPRRISFTRASSSAPRIVVQGAYPPDIGSIMASPPLNDEP
jgi:hypothetical protein